MLGGGSLETENKGYDHRSYANNLLKPKKKFRPEYVQQ